MPLAPCKDCGSRYCFARSERVCIHTGRKRQAYATMKQAVVTMDKQVHAAPASKGLQ